MPERDFERRYARENRVHAEPTLRARAVLAASLALCACETTQTSAAPASNAAATARPSAARTETAASSAPKRPPEPAVVLSVSSSAYGAAIAADAEAAYLLTSDVAYRLSLGSAAEAQRVELGFGATATGHALVFWSDGAVRELSKGDGKGRRLAELANRPQVIVSSENDVGWIARSAGGGFSLGSIAHRRASTVYTSVGSIDAADMSSGWIFFVERPAQAVWRIGRVRASGGTPEFTASRPGRAPSMLVARRELYYYDGNRREVRRLAPDFHDEETLVSDFVCTPLAVAERVYCANVEGIFELVPGARPRALVKLPNGRFVAHLAASATHLYWVSDAGPDKLEVSVLSLRE